MADKREEAWLRWTCLCCTKSWDVQMPGFPGSRLGGWHSHYEGGNPEVRCDGPIVAVMVIDHD